jgi:hypothetical protein
MEKSELKTINKLVRMAFGKGFSGNCIVFESEGKQHIVKGDKLESIAKRKWPYIPKINEKYEVAGKFTSENGSSLNVNLQYANAAERYASYYQIHFDKDTSVNGKKVLIKFKGLKR